MNGLKFIRSYLYMSSEALANKLGVSRSMISMWENSQKLIPPKRLEELSELFGVEKELFGEISEEQQIELMGRNCYYNKNDDAYTFNKERSSYPNGFNNLSFGNDMNLDSDEFHNDAEYKKEVNEYLQILKTELNKDRNIYGIKFDLCIKKSDLKLYKEFSELMSTKSLESPINSTMISIVMKALKITFGLEVEDVSENEAPFISALSDILLEKAEEYSKVRYTFMATQNTESQYFEKLSKGLTPERYIDNYVSEHTKKAIKQMNVKTRTVTYQTLAEKEKESTELAERLRKGADS